MLCATSHLEGARRLPILAHGRLENARTPKEHQVYGPRMEPMFKSLLICDYGYVNRNPVGLGLRQLPPHPYREKCQATVPVTRRSARIAFASVHDWHSLRLMAGESAAGRDQLDRGHDQQQNDRQRDRIFGNILPIIADPELAQQGSHAGTHDE